MSTVDPVAGHEIHDDLALAGAIRQSLGSDDIVQTTLRTDERVIARITDGIYRQPGSALRELISNAYDADAQRVVIKTDAPRFDRILVEDDGHGMSPEALAHLLLHIGGSAKRSEAGTTLGITAKSDPFRSPHGRRLIGKIGIGLFSVSQLTHSFQIITKVKSDSFRTIATVALRHYADDDRPESLEPDRKFESGKVNIWREKAADLESHGTTIVLTAIRKQAQDTLRSRDVWAAIEQQERESADASRPPLLPPKFHVGRVDSSGELLTKTSGRFSTVPWDRDDAPGDAFKKLVDCVWDEVERANPNPQLERIFDNYLRMIWQLSLSVPLPYVGGHLFDMDLSGWAEAFELSNAPSGAATSVDLRKAGSIREKLDLKDPNDSGLPFAVFVDELKLARPIKFRGLPTTSHALKKPLVFLGKCRETFGGIAPELSGGPLEFEAYLFWSPKIAPTEHQGSLIRIHGSSGTLFDPTFMRYQVSEQTRLRQISCEVFVREGLDSALNIDRESFNNAHPHSVYITRWLHSALRQLASTQKRLAAGVRIESRETKTDAALAAVQQVAVDLWKEVSGDPASLPPAIELSPTGERLTSGGEAYVFLRSAIVRDGDGRKTAGVKAQNAILEEKLKAIAQILLAFRLVERLSEQEQERLLRAVYDILQAPNA